MQLSGFYLLKHTNILRDKNGSLNHYIWRCIAGFTVDALGIAANPRPVSPHLAKVND